MVFKIFFKIPNYKDINNAKSDIRSINKSISPGKINSIAVIFFYNLCNLIFFIKKISFQ